MAGDRRAPPPTGMAIGGVQWMTLLDYPGRVAAALFTIGCNLRCPFCHNHELAMAGRSVRHLDEAALWETIQQRAGFLDAVVISGGEPTLQRGLPAFLERLKRTGWLVKLDTNGTHPEVLEQLLAAGTIDYVAMDVKAPLADYDRLAGVPCDVEAIERSIETIRRAAPDYEFRTTAAPTLTRDDLLDLGRRLAGAKRYVLQPFRVPETGLLDPVWEAMPALSPDELHAVWNVLAKRFADGGVRG